MSLINWVTSFFEASRQQGMPETSNDLAVAKAQAVQNSQAGEVALTVTVRQMIERDEGDRLTAYPDPGTGGEPWTIGYGHTGPDVTPDLTITEAQAQLLLTGDLHKFEEGVKELVGDTPTNDGQFSAMVSLSYNIGLGNFQRSSVLRFHNQGNYQQAADAFLLWDKAAGQVMAGLVRRRRQEREAYLGLAIEP